MRDYYKRRRVLPKPLVILTVLFASALVLISAFFYVKYSYTVKNVYVEGNLHYTDDEIKDIILKDKYANNSLFLSYKYKNKEITDIPFIETINVSVESKDTIKISVYEKTLAGYIEYLGKNIYFDKDGIVVEVSEVYTKGVPEVVGVSFNYVVLHEALPAKDKDIFRRVLQVTQLMTKYDVSAQKMYFAPNGTIFLYKDDITIDLGTDDNIDIKIMNLPSILENLEGENGILRMSEYDEGTKRVFFERKQ